MKVKKQKLEELSHFANNYYPKEISTKLAHTKYTKDENKPYYILASKMDATAKQREEITPQIAVAHCFIRDFRIMDNHALSKAYNTATKHNLPMVCFWVDCPEQREAHVDAPFKHYYRMLSLEMVQKKLEPLNIQVVTVYAEKRTDIVPKIKEFLEKYKINHLYSNIEYEVDELRLVENLLDTLLKLNIAYFPCHDTCIVTPGELKTKSKGTQYAVFSPWYKAWVQYANDEYLSKKNFVFPTPNKKLEELIKVEEKANFPHGNLDKERFHRYFKLIGEDGAREALSRYIASPAIKGYDDTRDSLDDDTVSHLSVHISSGTISTRSILQELFEQKKLSKNNRAQATGIAEWVRQVSWRDFYKHIMCNWPYVAMHKPFHLELSDLEWEYNKDHFLSWCEGKTGFPIVDACMRCLNESSYLNNRGRLIVASFLAKDLLLDWRNGERYFMLKLADGDFSSNNGGWGFSASTGVDPQPYFRILNPWTQSARFDPIGTFIRKWVPELKDIEGKAIHNPYSSQDAAEIARKNNYPEPIVDHKACRERALERYKTAMETGKANLK